MYFILKKRVYKIFVKKLFLFIKNTVSLLRRDKPEKFEHILAFVYIFAQYFGWNV